MNQNLHIVPHDGDWAVRRAGDDEPVATHPTQKEAVEAAMDIAEKEESDIIVHRSNGSFRNVIRYQSIADREDDGISAGQLAWMIAIGVISAAAVYLAVHPPREARRLWRKIDCERPDWLRLSA